MTFVVLITISRFRNRGKVLVEICFEPVGIFLSDISLFRPPTRVAHLHETLMRISTCYTERRLRSVLKRFQKVVVADVERARILQHQTHLREMPCVVPNYPKLGPAVEGCTKKNGGFEVIYTGSLGLVQKLDVVIRSVRLWPDGACFTVLGNDDQPIALQLKKLAKEMDVAERVKFEGWLDLEFLNCRLRRAHLGICLFDPISDQFIFSVGASNKRYQYMQAGLPQIGDINPGVLELLEGQGIGRCVRDFTEHEIADLVSYYAKNEIVRSEEGRRAEMLHRERLNYDVAFSGLLSWIVGQADCPAID